MRYRSLLVLIFLVIFIFLASVSCGVKGPPKAPLKKVSKDFSTGR